MRKITTHSNTLLALCLLALSIVVVELVEIVGHGGLLGEDLFEHLGLALLHQMHLLKDHLLKYFIRVLLLWWTSFDIVHGLGSCMSALLNMILLLLQPTLDRTTRSFICRPQIRIIIVLFTRVLPVKGIWSRV